MDTFTRFVVALWPALFVARLVWLLVPGPGPDAEPYRGEVSGWASSGDD